MRIWIRPFQKWYGSTFSEIQKNHSDPDPQPCSFTLPSAMIISLGPNSIPFLSQKVFFLSKIDTKHRFRSFLHLQPVWICCCCLPCNHCSNWTWVVEEILACIERGSKRFLFIYYTNSLPSIFFSKKKVWIGFENKEIKFIVILGVQEVLSLREENYLFLFLLFFHLSSYVFSCLF